MPLKVKIIHIYIYYLMYNHLHNLDVAFLLSVSIQLSPQGPSWPKILGRSDFSLQEN